MDLKPDQEKVKVLLIDTISLLCRSGLSFNRNIMIQGVLGITVDRSEVFLVHINQELSPSDDIECVDISSRSINKIDVIQQQKPYENKLKIKLNNSKTDPNKESNFYISNQDSDGSSHPRRPLTYQPSYDSPAINVSNTNAGRNDDDNRSVMFSPSPRIKKEPGYTSTPYQGSQGSEINDSQSNFCPQNNSMNDPAMQQTPFKFDISFSGDFNPMRGVGSNRRASRRRGGRRGGTVGTRPIRMDGNDGNTTWESMVTTSFMCKVCGQSFVHKSNLLGHQIRIHGRQKNKRGRPPSNNNNHSMTASQVVTTTNSYTENNVPFNEYSSQNTTMFDPSGFDGGYPNNNNNNSSSSHPHHYPVSRQISLRGDSDESSDQPVEEAPTTVDRPSGQDFDYGSDFHHNGMTNQNYPTTPRW